MRTLLLVTALVAVTVHGKEGSGPTMRQKVQAKIIESAPPPEPSKPAPDQKKNEEQVPPVVMNTVVVSESKLIREVTAALEREKQNRQDERFSPLQGGKIANLGPMQLGGWWTPDEGWSFLRLNKGRTPRQTETAETRLKELQELADMAADRRPSSKPSATKSPSWRRTEFGR